MTKYVYDTRRLRCKVTTTDNLDITLQLQIRKYWWWPWWSELYGSIKVKEGEKITGWPDDENPIILGFYGMEIWKLGTLNIKTRVLEMFKFHYTFKKEYTKGLDKINKQLKDL